MPVTVINRPQGYKLFMTSHGATVSDSSGDALFSSADGAIETDRYIYLESDIESYSGFKRMVSTGGSTFKVYDQIDGDPVQFKQTATVSYYFSTLDHGWQSVHLPIVYEIDSDLSPIDRADFALGRMVGAFANDNGYTRIAISVASLTNWESLNYIQLIGDGPLAGIYQIVEGFDSAHINIDLAYDAGYDFSPYTVVEYKNNYWVGIDIYAGLQSHRWSSVKPFSLRSTLRMIPDSNGRIKFSISEILKSFISTRNNLIQDTLPNNVDFYTQFSIEIFEGYDAVVDGSIVTHTESPTPDDFIGHAVNSMMPFKSFYQSFMSDYIYDKWTMARWLHTQDRPVAVAGYFFDLSFLLNVDIDIIVRIEKKSLGNTQDVEDVEYTDPDLGVIRVPIDIDSAYDEYCVSILAADPIITQPTNNSFTPGMSEWSTNTQYGGGTKDWTYASAPQVSLANTALGERSKDVLQSYPLEAGITYTFSINGSSTGVGGPYVRLYARNSSTTYETVDQNNQVASGAFSLAFTLTPTEDTDQLYFTVHTPPLSARVVTVDEIILETVSQGFQLVETMCISIVDECANILTDDDIRITEDDTLRRLE